MFNRIRIYISAIYAKCIHVPCGKFALFREDSEFYVADLNFACYNRYLQILF